MIKTNTKSSLLGKNSDIRTVVVVTIGFVVAIVVAQLVMGLVSEGQLSYPSFISSVNILNILMQTAGVGIMAMGMCTIMLSGDIDLSVGMLVSLVAIFIAKGIRDWGIPLPTALILAILIAVGLESLMGLVISRFKVESFIITLGGSIAFRGIALLMCNSQEVTLTGQLDFFKTNLIGGATNTQGMSLTLPIYVIIFFAIFVIFWAVLKYTRFGRRVYAVGSNAQAAYLSGVNVKNVRLLSYALNGLCVGIAGILLLSRVNVGIISIGQSLEIDVIASVVIGGVALSGGKGNAVGVFIGVLLMGAISNAMNILRVQSEWQYFVKGVIIIVAVTGGAISEIVNARRALRLQEMEARALNGQKELQDTTTSQ